MANDQKSRTTEGEWPVNFEAVEDEHLKRMMNVSPEKRLEIAEELLEFAILAGAVKSKD